MPYHTIINHRTHLLPILTLLFFIYPSTTAQPSPPSNDYGSPLSPKAIIIVATICSLGFVTCYIRQLISCFRFYLLGRTQGGAGDNDNGGARRGETASGLDPAILATFPIFLYSDVKVHLVNKTTPLECAICLAEFVDPELLRLLPICSHVFHPHCIAPWLTFHVTCPVCRANLEIPVNNNQLLPHHDESLAVQVLQQPCQEESEPSNQITQPPDGDAIIHLGSSSETMIKSPTVQTSNGVDNHRGIFLRSHSTGHSLVEDRERFTLRLPEEVRNKLVNVNYLSCSPPAIVSPRAGYRTGRRSNSWATIPVKLDQWRFTKSPPFISRAESTGIVECSSNNKSSNIAGIIRSPRSLFKSTKSPSKSPLVAQCDDIGERSLDRLWPPHPTSQELKLERQ